MPTLIISHPVLSLLSRMSSPLTYYPRKMSTKAHQTRYAVRRIEKEYTEWVNNINSVVLVQIGVQCDELGDENYRELFDEGVSYEAITHMICKKSFNVWKESVRTKVFDTIRVFLEILPDELYRISFDNGLSYSAMAELIIKKHKNDDFTKWMKSVDGHVHFALQIHLDKICEHFPTEDYLNEFNNGAVPIKFACELIKWHRWIKCVENIFFLATNKYFNPQQVLCANDLYKSEAIPDDAFRELHDAYIKTEFSEWRTKVDVKVFSEIQHHLEDLPDEDYMMVFENGKSVNYMAKFVIGNYYGDCTFLASIMNKRGDKIY